MCVGKQVDWDGESKLNSEKVNNRLYSIFLSIFVSATYGLFEPVGL